MTTRLLLIRHAEPHADVRGRCYGTLDVGLSEAGRRAAAALGRNLATAGVGTVVSSPRRRAIDTARELAAEPLVDDRLRELHFGELEGRPYAEVEREHPDLYRRWMAAPTSVRFPGGESFADLRARAVDAARDLRARHAGTVVAVVTHGGIVRTLLGDALRLEPEHVFRLDVGFCRVSVVDTIDGADVVRLVNGTADRLPAAALGAA